MRRIIPILTLKGKRLVKTRQFRAPVYLGDPINSVSIFNAKEVDELALICIDSKFELDSTYIKYLNLISSQAFMPLSYGGGIRKLEQIEMLLKSGFEKVILNTAVFKQSSLVKAAVANFGSQAIVASIDVGKRFGRENVKVECGHLVTNFGAVEAAKFAEALGVGEVMLRPIERDGMMCGLDLPLIEYVTDSIAVPVVAHGGVGSVRDIYAGFKSGAAAVGASSLFVFEPRSRAVLLSYPEIRED